MSDDTYLRMVLALPPSFFEGWQWSAGDRAITTNDREVVIMDSPLVQQKRGNGWIKAIFPESAYDEWDLFKVSDLRLLPSQKQLQDILMKHSIDSLSPDDKEWYPYFELNGFTNFVDNQIENQGFDKVKHLDLDCLWLMYAVWIFYEMKWDGEKWC